MIINSIRETYKQRMVEIWKLRKCIHYGIFKPKQLLGNMLQERDFKVNLCITPVFNPLKSADEAIESQSETLL